MADQRRPGLSEAELEVLKALWTGGPGTVRQVNERLDGRGRRWAYTTVHTLLQRLQTKGWVESDTSGSAHIFRAAASRDEWLRQQLETLADRACEGASLPLMLALVHRGRFTAREISDFRKLLEQYERGSEGKRRAGE